MFLDTRDGKKEIISQLPAQYKFADGRTTGDFQSVAPEIYIAEGFLPYEEKTVSYDSKTQVAVVADVAIADGKAEQSWVVRDKTPDELDAELSGKWAAIRAQRNNLLLEVDWTHLTDSNCADKWKLYRQELRDIPQTYATPNTIVWPLKP